MYGRLLMCGVVALQGEDEVGCGVLATTESHGDSGHSCCDHLQCGVGEARIEPWLM